MDPFRELAVPHIRGLARHSAGLYRWIKTVEFFD